MTQVAEKHDVEAKLLDGFYTVAFKQGEQRGHRTFRVRTQRSDADFMPGKQIVSYLMGSDNTSDYRSLGMISGNNLTVWKKYQHAADMTLLVKAASLLLTDWIAHKAGEMYAMESGNCYHCNRMLTDLLSIERSVGPECWKKYGHGGAEKTVKQD